MLRNSTFLAIALGVTAIASATNPAAAFSSQLLGGASNHLVPQMQPAKAYTGVQTSQNADRPKIVADPVAKKTFPTAAPKPVYSGLGPDGKLIPAVQPKIPAGDATKVVKGAEVTKDDLFCAKHPTVDFCHSGSTPTPPTPPPPSHHCEAGGTECRIPLPNLGGDPSGGKSGGGTVVILAPSVQVPVAVPYGVPARVTSGPSYAATTRPAVASQPITPQCGAAGSIPALAAGIDQLLPTAQLSEADMSKVTELRQMIQVLSTDGKASAARDVEEIAMNLLGYQKVWLRCGLGTFDWEKQVASADAVQQK